MQKSNSWDGNINSKIMIIDETPGLEEEKERHF